MKFFWVWLINLCLFTSICVGAVITVAPTVCGDWQPILLSQAGTTDPWRGFLIAMGLWMVFCANKLEDSQMSIAFFGFLLAFVVSMFETDAHVILIIFSGVFLMREIAWKIWNMDEKWSNPWTYVVLTDVVVGAVFLGWAITCYINEWPSCSLWYLTEYAAFILLFASTFVLIDMDKEFSFKDINTSILHDLTFE